VYDTLASVSWVHRVVLHHEGSGNREDGSIRDGGVKMNETEQEKEARQAFKHVKCTERCWDGAQDDLLRATNHPHIEPQRIIFPTTNYTDKKISYNLTPLQKENISYFMR